MDGRVKLGFAVFAPVSVTGVSPWPSTLGTCSHVYVSAPMLSAPFSVTLLPRSTVWAAPARAATASATVTRTGTISSLLSPVSPTTTSLNSYRPAGAVNVSCRASRGLVRLTSGSAGGVHRYEVASSDSEASMVTVWLASGRVGVTIATATGGSGGVNGPLVVSGTVAVPPSDDFTVMTCGGASMPSKAPSPPVIAPYPTTLSAAAGSLDVASTVSVVSS